MANRKVTDRVAEWMAEYGEKNGYELSRSEFVKEGSSWYLRVYVDKLEDGEYVSMGTDDCEAISRFLSEKLDEADPISQNYVLEVSSPGLDRPLISDKDFERFKGELVDVSLYEAVGGSKLLSGELIERTGEELRILSGKGEISLPLAKVAAVRLAVVF